MCHGLFFPYQKHFPASLLLSLQQASALSEASFHVLSFLCPEKLNLRLESAKHLSFSLLFFSFLLRRMRSGLLTNQSGFGAECVFRPSRSTTPSSLMGFSL